MINQNHKLCLAAACVCLISAVTFAQFRGGRGGRRPPDASERGNVPLWKLTPGFERDCFTFARLKYTTAGAERTSRAWWTDFPDADLNLS